jgi:putative glutamine amidotransferase
MPKRKSSRSTARARPRIGVPWRTAKQERNRDMRYNQLYLDAIRAAGGQPVQISLLQSPAKLARMAKTFDGFVLPGSPADITPALFGARAHAKAAQPDPAREKTDFALLKHALPAGKPVLAICYGIQSLNVFCGGSLVQDIPSELPRALAHSSRSDKRDAAHEIRIVEGDLANLAGGAPVSVNSVHHQSIEQPGQGLRVTAQAPDGVIEAVEWTAGPGWALGVQWHPERMPEDPLARKIFLRLVEEAGAAERRARIAGANPSAAIGRKATRPAVKAIHRSSRNSKTGRRS